MTSKTKILELRCVQFDFGAEKNHSLETRDANKLVIIDVYTHTNFGINLTNSIYIMTKPTPNQPTNTLLVIESMTTRSTTTACEQ